MNILLTPVPVGYGTTERCLAVAAECRGRGHRVLFACAAEMHQRIGDRDFPVRAIRDSKIDPGSPRPPARQYLNQHTPRLLAEQLEELQAAMREFQPDVAVSSHNTVTMIAAATQGVPSVSIFHPAILEASSPAMLLALLAERLRVGVLTRRARVRRPVPPPPLGDLSCIPSIPELVRWPWLLPPELHRHRDQAIPVGALLMEDPADLPECAQLRQELGVPETGPFVFATVGGAVAEERFVRALVDGLRRAGVAAICSVGNRLPEQVLHDLDRPPVRVVRSIPDDLRAMRVADALLWHGGHETMLKAVACGLPAVGVPLQFDQASNVAALQRTGAGLRVQPRRGKLEPQRIAEAITRVISDPSFRAAAEHLAASNRRAGGASHLVDLIELLLVPQRQQAA